MYKKGSDEQGFTLIEIMVVIIILGILATYVAPKFFGQADEAKITQTKTQIASLETALKLYRLDNGTYPSTEQGLQALVEPPSVGILPRKWREKGYLEKGIVPKDLWGNEFIYLCPGLHSDFDLLSYGNDGVESGEGKDADITNWVTE